MDIYGNLKEGIQMTQTLTHQDSGLKDLNLVAWRIRRSRAENREIAVNRQLMERLHGDKPRLAS
jgi:hypothetical protein